MLDVLDVLDLSGLSRRLDGICVHRVVSLCVFIGNMANNSNALTLVTSSHHYLIFANSWLQKMVKLYINFLSVIFVVYQFGEVLLGE